MSTFADAYSRYLTNHFNYTNKITTFRKYFKNSINSLTDPNFMSKRLASRIDDFPKYPYFLNAMARTDAINLVKIYNSSLDNTDKLTESMIGSSELQKKEFYDTVPSSVDEFLAELSFQFSYISTSTNLYDYDLIVRSFITEYQYRNFFSDTYSDLFHSTDQLAGTTAGLETKSFLYQYMLYSCLYNALISSHSIYSKTLEYISHINIVGSPTETVDSSNVLYGFSTFIEGDPLVGSSGYHENLSIDLAGIIGKSIYDFQNISTQMSQELVTVIDAKILSKSTALTNGTATFAASTTVILSNVAIYNSISVGDIIYNSTNDTISKAVGVISLSDGVTHTGPYTLTLESAYTGTVGSGKIISILSNLYSTFYKFYNPVVSFAPLDFVTNNTIQQLNALVAADIVSKIYIDDNIIDQIATTTETVTEEISYASCMALILEPQLKNYLFLCFLYKFWPIKFLNVLQLSIKEYVENHIKTTNDNILTQADYGYKFTYFNNNYIHYDELSSFIGTYICPVAAIAQTISAVDAEFTFTPGSSTVVCSNLASYNAINTHEYIYAYGDSRQYAGHVMSKDLGTLSLILDNEYEGIISTANVHAYRYTFYSSNYMFETALNNQVPDLAATNYYIYILDEFFKSTVYNTFVEELTEDIFTYLRNNGHVNYDFDWYEYHDVVDVYLKVFLRWKLTDQSTRCVLPTYKNAMFKFTNNSSIVICANLETYNLVSVGQYIYSSQDTFDNATQILSKSISGTTYSLTLTSVYSGKTSSQYTFAYRFNSIDVPLFNNVTENFKTLFSKVLVNITSDPIYDIDIVVDNDSDLENLFTSFSSSLSFIRSMHQFSENLMLSALTRETIYSVLSEFV